MTPDDDLAKLLPPPPPPRPNRREAAVEAAMRGYDGAGAPLPGASGPPRQRRPWIGSNRPLVGAIATVALVVTIGLPAWMASDHGPRTAVTDLSQPDMPQSAADAPMRQQSVKSADIAGEPTLSPQPTESANVAARAPVAVAPQDASVPDAADDPVANPSETAFAAAPAPPPPPPPPAAVVAAPAAEQFDKAENIVVTGARVSSEGVAGSQGRTSSSRNASRDLTQCTVVDPRRDIEACRTVIEKTVSKRARPFIVEGVSRAWQGDLSGAEAALDRAIVQSPRSAFAFYNRSLVLSQRGETRRAAADRERAVELDADYRAAFD